MNEIDEMRKKRDEAICKEWMDTAPDAVRDGQPPSRVIAAIAAKNGLTAQGVEQILRRGGVYEGAKEYKKNLNTESHDE